MMDQGQDNYNAAVVGEGVDELGLGIGRAVRQEEQDKVMPSPSLVQQSARSQALPCSSQTPAAYSLPS